MIRFISRVVALGAMLALLVSVQCFASCMMRSCDSPGTSCHHEKPQSGAKMSCPFAHFALDQRIEAVVVSPILVIAPLIQLSSRATPALVDSLFTVRANPSPPVLASPSIIVLRV